MRDGGKATITVVPSLTLLVMKISPSCISTSFFGNRQSEARAAKLGADALVRLAEWLHPGKLSARNDGLSSRKVRDCTSPKVALRLCVKRSGSSPQ